MKFFLIVVEIVVKFFFILFIFEFSSVVLGSFDGVFWVEFGDSFGIIYCMVCFMGMIYIYLIIVIVSICKLGRSVFLFLVFKLGFVIVIEYIVCIMLFFLIIYWFIY